MDIPLEIERRFFVRSLPKFLDSQRVVITQGYLSFSPIAVRVRVTGKEALLTMKCPTTESADGALTRQEVEHVIPIAKAKQMLSLCDPQQLIQKDRYRITHAGQLYEVDVFKGRHHGLVIAEAELKHPQQELTLPAWIGQEITHDSRYSNIELAQFGLPNNFAPKNFTNF